MIALPSSWTFQIDLPVRITDFNYGHLLGNDSFLSLLQEARVRWLHREGWTELKIDGSTGLILVELEVRFKAEAVFGDVLRIELAPTEWSSVGFDLLYRATNAATGDEIARARTGMGFFDYAARKLARVPAGVREKMERVTAGG